VKKRFYIIFGDQWRSEGVRGGGTDRAGYGVR